MNKRALMLSAAAVALLSAQALADTTINTKLTSPINTATDGNITIDSDGSVVITTNPPTVAAVTINSDATVNNSGTISYKGVTDATGVELVTGNTGEFEGIGTVDLTGSGDSKTGIVVSGPAGNLNSGTFTGVIPNGGTSPVAIDLMSGSTLSVQGDNSVGIKQLSGTNIVGDIDLAGIVTMVPTSATSTKTSLGNEIAVDLAGTLTGNIDIASGASVTASGQGAEGILLLGTVTGSFINNGTLQTYGTANVVNVNVTQPEAANALGIGASVTGGIYNAGPSTVSDTTTLRALISTAGDESAVIINPALSNPSPSGNLEIGVYNDTTDPGNSFINRGDISGTSINPDINVTTFSIVGANNNPVTPAQTIFDGGFFNGGAITAAATTDTKASTVSANALYIGDYTLICNSPTLPNCATAALNNSNESGAGTISATVEGPESGNATAILISQYGDLPSINNSGTISASVLTSNPKFVTSLSAFAILDQSGTLQSITNSGTISAIATTLANNGQITVAADLSVDRNNVQFDNSGTVLGAIRFGSGADTLTDSGTAQKPASIIGNVSFGGTATGGGGDDTLDIGLFGSLTGAVTETLGSHVNVSIAQGGTLDLQNTSANLGAAVVGLYAGSFDVDPGANLGIVVSQPFNLSVNPQSLALIQTQSAIIGTDANFAVTFGSYIGNYLPGLGYQGRGPTATFDLLSAPIGSLSISPDEIALINDSFAKTIPYLFTGQLCTWNINGRSTCGGINPGDSQLVLDLTPKSAQTLGLTGYALKMFPYANESLFSDDLLGAAMLNNVNNAQEAQAAYDAYAPDVSGATRALAVSLTDEATNVVADRQRVLREYAGQDGDLTLWTQEFAERLNQDNTNVGTGYSDSGFGFVVGADEGNPEDGRYGGAFTFFSGGMSAKAPLLQKTESEWYMATGYTDWHGKVFFLDTQATVGYAHLTGSRTIELGSFTRSADETHPAEYVAGGATAGVQYDVLGAAVMPQISLDGLAMREEGYTEETAQAQAGQIANGFNLHVDPNYAASLRAFAGLDTRGDINLGDFLLQPEARAGYRYDFANGQESVTTNFVDVVPIDQFKISGPKPSPGNALAGAGLSLSTGAWSIGLSFDYLYANSGNTSEEGTLTLLGRI
ncbi:MAG: autotransporter domain-containing protein [Rhizomicrobium sp.]